MTISTVNSSATTAYQTKTLVNTEYLQAQTDSSGNTNTTAPSMTSSYLFVQNILQSLQGIGVDTTNVSDPTSSANGALQTFVQDLYTSLSQFSNQSATTVAVSAANTAITTADSTTTLTPSTDPTPTSFSGGTNFKYNVDLSGANLGDNLSNIERSLKQALDNIGQVISSNAVFNLKIKSESINSSTLAETNSSMVYSKDNLNGSNADTTFIYDALNNTQSATNTPDATLYINLAKIGDMSFSGTPTADKFDLPTILTHEILHGLAFAGGLDSNPTSTSVITTTYDGLVTMSNNTPMFTGQHAETVNGGNAVPLAPASVGSGSSYYHVAIPNDLMSMGISKGEIRSISPLDIAMLQDMGITTVSNDSATPVLAMTQNPYNSVPNLSTSIRKLSDSVTSSATLITDFTNLVQTLGTTSTASTSPDLQTFLSQLATNTENTNVANTSAGAFFSGQA